MAQAPTDIAELKAEADRAEVAFKDALADMLRRVDPADANDIADAVVDGLAIGLSDAIAEAMPPTEFWNPRKSDGRDD